MNHHWFVISRSICLILQYFSIHTTSCLPRLPKHLPPSLTPNHIQYITWLNPLNVIIPTNIFKSPCLSTRKRHQRFVLSKLSTPNIAMLYSQFTGTNCNFLFVKLSSLFGSSGLSFVLRCIHDIISNPLLPISVWICDASVIHTTSWCLPKTSSSVDPHPYSIH